MKSLQGRVVVIADSSNELGKCLALEFARVGAILALWADDAAIAQQVAEQVRSAFPRATAHGYEVALTSSTGVQQAARAVRRDMGGHIDVLVNSVDVLHGATLLQSSNESLEHVVALNAQASVFTTQAVLSQMLTTGSDGVLVNFGSSADALGAPKLVDYCASKFAVMGFHDALRHELRELSKRDKKARNIHMMLVRPTLVAPQGGAAALPPGSQSRVPQIWLAPDRAARAIVRAVRRGQTTLVLPTEFSMLAGLFAIMPTALATWLRKQLKVSSVMDSYCAPTAGPNAFASV